MTTATGHRPAVQADPPHNVEAEEAAEQFWRNIDRSDPESCWPWLLKWKVRGYGMLTYRGEKILAHRRAWRLTNGPIPPGVGVLHRCDNPPCCNPDHLFLGTQADNMTDCAAKGRNVMQRHPERSPLHGNRIRRPQGEEQGNSHLTRDDVLAIRVLAKEGVTQRAIAKRFGTNQGHVSRIVRRESWAHV